MRFKAKLATEQVQLLYSLIGPISRLSSEAIGSSSTGGALSGVMGGGTVLHLDPQHVRLSTRGGGDGDGIACFAELATRDGIFLEHRIESAANNVIVFEIDLAQLRTALQSVLSGGYEGGRQKGVQSLHNSSSRDGTASLSSSITVVKLAKRNGGLPCLCIDAACAGGLVEVHHAIPVRIMRAAEMQYHLPPRISMPDVQLELPPDRPLRTVIERFKSISPHLYIEGSMAGELTLRVDGDGASIRTFFSKLIPRFEDCKASEEESATAQEAAHCTLKVDTKKLSSCLQWQTSMLRTVGSALLCMTENEMLVVHVLLNPATIGFFTYYVPVHFLSDETMD